MHHFIFFSRSYLIGTCIYINVSMKINSKIVGRLVDTAGARMLFRAPLSHNCHQPCLCTTESSPTLLPFQSSTTPISHHNHMVTTPHLPTSPFSKVSKTSTLHKKCRYNLKNYFSPKADCGLGIVHFMSRKV